MSHVIEPASSGRARCRGCGGLIPRGELRFGERIANPFAEGETTLWFHLVCAAYKRPEPLLEAMGTPGQALGEAPATAAELETLERAARGSLIHRRIPRIDGAERAPSGQAACRSCRQPIARETWRIRLVYFEEGRFSPGGFVHLACHRAYFESDELLDRILHFSPGLSDDERGELTRAFEPGPDPPEPPRIR